MLAAIEIYSWDQARRAWLATDSVATWDEAEAAVARRYRITREHGLPNAAFYASDDGAPGLPPQSLGLEITPEVERKAPAPRPAKPVGRDQPGARDVTLQVRGHVDDSDVVWFGSMCWPRDVFEAAGGVIIERTEKP